MIRIALVGSIGSGKTFISKLFLHPVFNADLEVEKIYKKNRKVFFELKKKLPKYFSSFPIEKNQLIKSILDNNNNLKTIIKVVHPIVRLKLKNFLKANKNKKIVILDIPLYFENKLNKKNDVVIFIQSKKKDIKKRLKKRKSFNKNIVKRFEKIQFPIEKKKKKSDYIIKNDFKERSVKKYVKYIMKLIYERNNIRH